LLLAWAVSFAAPLALAVLWERMLRRISDAEQFDHEGAVNVVGEVARLPAHSRRRHPSAAAHADLSLFEESVDSLRTCLVLGEAHADLRVIAVASAISGEGKTSVAAQLAVSIARATGAPTLLIDADLRSPDIHRVFQIANSPGLADVLEENCTLAEAVNTEWSEFVHVLPGGRVASNPHALMNNGLLPRLLDEARAEYAYIVIDTPPILLASESLVVASAADGRLLCTMRDFSRESQVKSACVRLRAVGAPTLGAVLNGIPARQYASKYGSYPYARSHAS
jgi:capsular exopolysaccharide synthesis family protein